MDSQIKNFSQNTYSIQTFVKVQFDYEGSIYQADVNIIDLVECESDKIVQIVYIERFPYEGEIESSLKVKICEKVKEQILQDFPLWSKVSKEDLIGLEKIALEVFNAYPKTLDKLKD